MKNQLAASDYTCKTLRLKLVPFPGLYLSLLDILLFHNGHSVGEGSSVKYHTLSHTVETPIPTLARRISLT